MAAVAGARRTDAALPRYAADSRVPDAAVLPNDPAVDDATLAQIAALDEVTAVYPFMVPFLLNVTQPEGMVSPLLAAAPGSVVAGASPYVAGRAPDPNRRDEI